MTEIATTNNSLATWMADELRPSPQPRRIDLKLWAEEFADVYRVSEALAKTPFVPREMMGKTADVAAAIMRGRELGLDPFDALGSIYIVHGRVGYWAEFMRRRIIQAGHAFEVVEQTDSRAVVEGTRRDTGKKHRVTYTQEQAKRNKVNLGDYPSDKLVARATSRLCRQVFPDVLAGSVLAEDLIDGLIPTGDDEPVAAVEASPGAVQRKRAPRAPAKAASTQPPDAPRRSDEPDDELAELLDDEPAPVKLVVVENAPADDEPPADDQAVEAEVVNPDLITPAQLRKLSILLREQGFDTPESKHGFTSAAINREITTAKELTKDEARAVIDILENSQAT
jgi:hypothetical protein